MATMLQRATAKEDLVVLCSRKSGKPRLAQSDIVYNVTKWPQGFQATVSLPCLGSVQYAGDVCDSHEEAERAAAAQALSANSDEVEILRKAGAFGCPGGLDAEGEEKEEEEALLESSHQRELEVYCMQRLGRAVGPDDIMYNITQWPQGFQGLVTMICFGSTTYAGELSKTSEGAREAAAQQALVEVVKEDQKKLESNTNHKFQLARLCTKKAGRRMVKDDIIYKATKWDQGYQATVTLNCLGGVSYAGDLRPSVEESEQESAKQALLAVGETTGEAETAAVVTVSARAGELPQHFVEADTGGSGAGATASVATAAAAATTTAATEEGDRATTLPAEGGITWQELAAQAAGLPPGSADLGNSATLEALLAAQEQAVAAALADAEALQAAQQAVAMQQAMQQAALAEAAEATAGATGLADGMDMSTLWSGTSSSGGFDLTTYLASLTAAGLDAASAAQLAALAMENANATAALHGGVMVPDLSRLPDGSRFVKRPKHELPCRFYMKGSRQGFCRYGDTCQFSHDPLVIQHALSLGPIEPFMRSKDIACRFHASGSGRCNKGDDCNFSHDPEVIAKAVASGEVVLFVPRGKGAPRPFFEAAM